MKLQNALFALILACAVVLVGCSSSPQPMEEASHVAHEQAQHAAEQEESPGSEATMAHGSHARDSQAPAPLRVDGARLVNEQGETVQLRGISTHGLAWFPQYVNAELFGELSRDWGANVVRLAMYTAEGGGYCTDGDKEKLRQLVLDGVDYATDANLYVIVDWHILSDNNPLDHVDEAEAFFADMSARLSDQSNVLYEICNEPNGSTSWADVKAYAERIIPKIRANDPDSVILVGTPEWSQRIDQAAADPLDFGNVMYTLHFYAATHKDELLNRMTKAQEAGTPVFVSEFGICDASGNGEIDVDSSAAWVKSMDELGISYLMWNLSNKDESSSAILPECNKTAGFADADLSFAGRWLRSVLLNDASPTPEQRPTFTSGQFSYTLKKKTSWPVGNKVCTQYDLALTNEGETCDTWQIEVPFDGPIELVDGWNGTYAVKDNTLVVANESYNGHVAQGETIKDVGFQVTQ